MSKKSKKKKKTGGAFGSTSSWVPSSMDWARAEKDLREAAEQCGFEMSPLVPLTDLIECHEKRN